MRSPVSPARYRATIPVTRVRQAIASGRTRSIKWRVSRAAGLLKAEQQAARERDTAGALKALLPADD